jgi:hypothetical protein
VLKNEKKDEFIARESRLRLFRNVLSLQLAPGYCQYTFHNFSENAISDMVAPACLTTAAIAVEFQKLLPTALLTVPMWLLLPLPSLPLVITANAKRCACFFDRRAGTHTSCA